MALLLRFLLLTLAALLLGGCSALMPRSRTVTSDTISWKSYSDARAFFDQVQVGQTKLADLKKLGVDLGSSKNVEELATPSLITVFLANPAIPFTSLPGPLQMCLSYQENCVGYRISKRVTHKDGVGNFALRMTKFVEENETTGWYAQILFVIHDGVIVHKHIEGTPNGTTQHDKQVNPLGPLQGVNPISIGK